METQRTLEELLALFMLYRELGFEPSDIHFMPSAKDPQDPDGPRLLGMAVLTAHGGFFCALEKPADVAAVKAGWPSFAFNVASLSDGDKERIWERSYAKLARDQIAAEIEQNVRALPASVH